MSFFSELKRRNVYRVGALYVVVGWLILQVTDVVMSLLDLPAWTGKLVAVLLFIGLPIVLIGAWAFELTPDGLVRDRATGNTDRRAPMNHHLNCCRNLRSFSKNRRRSFTPYLSIVSRSTPMPKASPV